MIYQIITTQPDIYQSFLNTGLVSRGLDKGIIEIKIHNLHDFAFDKHQSVDDTPYGGGAGMVLRVDVMANALNNVKAQMAKGKIILLTPQGKPFTQVKIKKLAKEKNLILIAGRFEGYDERIRGLVDEEISIGDYVLTSGDLPAMVLIDAVSRQVPKFIDKEESTQEESFSLKIDNSKIEKLLLEYPQYTKPENFEGQKVPAILLSGNHAAIAKWRKEQAVKQTRTRRPDLLS